MDVRLAGQIDCWPSQSEMATILCAAGLNIHVGTYSIRITDCQHFEIQEYGCDLGNPVFDADADSLPQMLEDAAKVSGALNAANLRHRFELYGEDNELVGYFHHRWPQLQGVEGDPCKPNCVYCTRCGSHREDEEFRFLCIVPELGNLSRYLCNACGDIITLLPGSFIPTEQTDNL
jgi:hypothetical protein